MVDIPLGPMMSHLLARMNRVVILLHLLFIIDQGLGNETKDKLNCI